MALHKFIVLLLYNLILAFDLVTSTQTQFKTRTLTHYHIHKVSWVTCFLTLLRPQRHVDHRGDGIDGTVVPYRFRH